MIETSVVCSGNGGYQNSTTKISKYRRYEGVGRGSESGGGDHDCCGGGAP